MSEPITETIGLDMGDRYTQYCILDQRSGKAVGTGRVGTTPSKMQAFLSTYPSARVVLEVGTHSRWASEAAQERAPKALLEDACIDHGQGDVTPPRAIRPSVTIACT